MIRKLLMQWLLHDVDLRLKDIERHFVTKRDGTGKPLETLADVPMEKRKEIVKPSLAGMSWPQRRNILEQTDGLRKLNG